MVPGKAGWAGVEGLLQVICNAARDRKRILMLQMAINLRRTLVEHSRRRAEEGGQHTDGELRRHEGHNRPLQSYLYLPIFIYKHIVCRWVLTYT